MLSEFQEILNKTPEKLQVKHKMSIPNDDILIYQGTIYIKVDDKIYSYKDAKITLKWKPSHKYIFEFVPSKEVAYLIEAFLFGKSNQVAVGVDGTVFYDASFYSLNDEVYKIFTKKVELGIRPKKFKYVEFDLPNTNSMLGELIKSGKNVLLERFTIRTNKVIITIDMDDDFSAKARQLRYHEGILTNARCRIDFKQSSSHEQMTQECQCFNYFISFILGRWTSMFCIEVDDNYKLYYAPYIQSFQYHSDKFNSSFNSNGLDDAFTIFSKMWRGSKDNAFLKKVIEWYTDISIAQKQHDASIILGQTTLELMYNHLLKNENLYLVGKDAESIATENKIRLLLKHFEIKSKLPEKYKKILAKFSEKSDFVDGPMLIAKVRNAYVHGQLQSEYFQLSTDEIYLVYDLVTAYIELVMIKMLNIRLNYHWRLKEFENYGKERNLKES
jgi:hypothetical protein